MTQTEKVKPKRKHTCPACGSEVDERVSTEALEDAYSDRFFQGAD